MQFKQTQILLKNSAQAGYKISYSILNKFHNYFIIIFKNKIEIFFINKYIKVWALEWVL